MFKVMTPAEAIRLTMKTSMMLGQAQMVIAMRSFGMMGMWRVTPAENTRMMAEKIEASQEVVLATAAAVARGGSAAVVANAALKPIARRTAANAKRLSRRGPGTPD